MRQSLVAVGFAVDSGDTYGGWQTLRASHPTFGDLGTEFGGEGLRDGSREFDVMLDGWTICAGSPRA